MKCPKCGYLGFETGDRCRVCGYDFSLLASPDPDLPLRPADQQAAPYTDFGLGESRLADAGTSSGRLDLDRLIGSGREGAAPPSQSSGEEAEGRLPLFDVGQPDDTPLIQSAGPPRPPLAVRRATPELPRVRARGPRAARREEPSLALEPDHPAAAEPALRRSPYVRRGPAEGESDAAGGGARLGAALIDIALLSGINAGIVYLTLQMAGLSLDEWHVLPLAPLSAFLAIVNGGYVVVFTASAGQTIGKMATGIRVVGEAGGRLDTGRALLRAAASLLSIGTLGAGFLPALLRSGGRTLHDRIAATRVVRGGW